MTMITSPQDARLIALTAWVSEQRGRACQLSPLGGDAGARRYFSLADDETLLAVDAPPATENTAQFLQVAALLSRHSVSVPVIEAADAEQGFLLVEHAREGLFAHHLGDDNTLLYGEAMLKLLALQQIPIDEAALPAFDSAFIRRELAVCEQWFFTGLLQFAPSPPEQALLRDLYNLLETSALEQPQVVMHRDYHSRNLVFARGGQLLAIDFQDAVIGPVTYDLVSLLKDCYYTLPPRQVRQWALNYGAMAADAGVITPVPAEIFLQWFDWMGLQRHIKVLGIFARLALRDNKTAYLSELPRVLGYIGEVLAQYPQLAAAHDWFNEELMPRVHTQPWWESPAP